MQGSHSHSETHLLSFMPRACALLYSWSSRPGLGPQPAMRRAQGWLRRAAALAVPLLFAACASVPRDASLPVHDPYEGTNRPIMKANQEILRPAAVVVDAAIPGPVHERLRDFNSNLKEPRIFVNNVLQGRVEAAAHTGARFAMNTVFGVAGLWDIATREGLE